VRIIKQKNRGKDFRRVSLRSRRSRYGRGLSKSSKISEAQEKATDAEPGSLLIFRKEDSRGEGWFPASSKMVGEQNSQKVGGGGKGGGGGGGRKVHSAKKRINAERKGRSRPDFGRKDWWMGKNTRSRKKKR